MTICGNVIGFDPGNSGAWAILAPTGEILDHGRFPLRKHGRRKVVSALDLAWALRDRGLQHAAVEEVHAMPGQGVSSMFTFGRGLGVLEGLLGSWGLTPTYYRPKAWQAVMLEGLPRGTQVKQSAVARAVELWPSLEDTLDVKAAWGIADAALIAECHRRALVAGEAT